MLERASSCFCSIIVLLWLWKHMGEVHPKVHSRWILCHLHKKESNKLWEKNWVYLCFNKYKISWWKSSNSVFNMKFCFYVKKKRRNTWNFEKRLCWYLLSAGRWKGQGVRMIVNGFNLFYSGGSKAKNRVEVGVAHWLVDQVVGVEWYSDKVMKNNVIIRDAV